MGMSLRSSEEEKNCVTVHSTWGYIRRQVNSRILLKQGEGKQGERGSDCGLTVTRGSGSSAFRSDLALRRD